MSIRVHHLNCGTMCPACERLINGGGSWLKSGKLVCHCLLIETPDCLVLVDTGLGQKDVLETKCRLGSVYPFLFRPALSLDETAIAQIRALGYDPCDVRHILPTHVDLDHVGGLSDFPDAEVHIFKPELDQILNPTRRDLARFRMVQFDHKPKWIVHEAQGESWFGFGCIRTIPGLDADILIVPLIGHTKGHAGIAVREGDRWLLHCGDAYYHHSEISPVPRVPAVLGFFERAIQAIPEARIRNQARLQALAAECGDEVELFCAHDPVELERYTAGAGVKTRAAKAALNSLN